MKKVYLSFLMLLGLMTFNPGKSSATIHNVEVEDFEFNPTTFIANVGDTIHWFWDEGFHTTTSFLIPAGAPTWDQPIFSSSPTFDYVITVPGSYDYICSPHASMGMTGHFTALGATGVPENTAPSLSLVSQYVNDGMLQITYSLPLASSLDVNLYDLSGKIVMTESFSKLNAGMHSNTLFVGTLPKSIYLLELASANKKITRKIVSQ